MTIVGGWKGALGRLFNLISVLGIAALFFTMVNVYYRFGFDPWFVGLTTVVGYVVVDLLARNVIDEREGEYYLPLLDVSLNPRFRLFFILFLLILFGSLGGAVVAALIVGVPELFADGYIGWVGSVVAIAFVYLDYWAVYTRKRHKHDGK